MNALNPTPQATQQLGGSTVMHSLVNACLRRKPAGRMTRLGWGWCNLGIELINKYTSCLHISPAHADHLDGCQTHGGGQRHVPPAQQAHGPRAVGGCRWLAAPLRRLCGAAGVATAQHIKASCIWPCRGLRTPSTRHADERASLVALKLAKAGSWRSGAFAQKGQRPDEMRLIRVCNCFQDAIDG